MLLNGWNMKGKWKKRWTKANYGAHSSEKKSWIMKIIFLGYTANDDYEQIDNWFSLEAMNQALQSFSFPILLISTLYIELLFSYSIISERWISSNSCDYLFILAGSTLWGILMKIWLLKEGFLIFDFKFKIKL